MSLFGRLKNLHLSYFSQPVHDRPLFRAMQTVAAKRILHLGVGDGDRAQKIIELAERTSPNDAITYVGVDLFEMRSPRGKSMSLKEAHKRFRATDAKIFLTPGDPYSALARIANTFSAMDLVVIAADQAGESLDRAWFYVPRMLAAGATMFVETLDAKGQPELKTLTRAEVDARAARSRPRRAAA